MVVKINCTRCKGAKPSPEHVFLTPELLETVTSNVCEECWREWLGEQTKLINELRLDVSRPEAHELLAQHMLWFFQIPGAKEPEGKVTLPPEAGGSSC